LVENLSTSLTNSVNGDSEIILKWKVHLARQHPTKLAGVLMVVAMTGLCACLWYGSIIPAAIMAFALSGALTDFLLPITYTFTSEKAFATTPLSIRVIAWKDVKRVYMDDDGIKLSPLDRRTRLEAYRGVYVRFGDRRDEVLEAARRLTKRDDA
jgi:hypothetical protein